MAGVVLPEGKQSFTTATGAPAVGWKLYAYVPTTTTPKDTYTTSTANVANAHPVVMDARGEATIYWVGDYDVVLKDSAGATIWGPERLNQPETAGAADTLRTDLATDNDAVKGAALIGYDDSLVYAAGVVGSALQDRGVCVTDAPYSAVGDGVTDDSAAIQAALDSGAKYVVFPPRNYALGSTLTVVTDGQTLQGYGAIITSKTVAASGFRIGWTGAAFTKTDDVTIAGFTFVGADDGSGSTYSYSISADGPTTNPYVLGGGCSNLRVIDCKSSGHCMGVVATAADGVSVSNCVFGGMKYHAALSAGGYGVLLQSCFDSKIIGNTFTAVSGDRHAIYISTNPDRAAAEDNVCKRVVIGDNAINWESIVGTTGFESAIVARGTDNLKVTGNVIIGGYGCFDYEGANWNGQAITLVGNSIRRPSSSGSERACITFLRSSGAYICTGVTISGNSLLSDGANTMDVSLVACDQVSITGNTLNQTDGVAAIKFGGSVTNVVIGNNSIKTDTSNACFTFSGASNSKITINQNQLDLTSTSRYVFTTTPATLRFGFVRCATIRANSTGSPVILTDEEGILASVGTDANGIVATFSDQVSDVTNQNLAFGANNSTVGNIYYRAAASQAITIGVADFAGAALPCASNTYDVTIFLAH